ncbi:unnamed protein product, partial [Polarella glacialis]
ESREKGFFKTMTCNQTRTLARGRHVKIFEWLLRHHRDKPSCPELADRLGRRLVRLGLARHPTHWTEILNEEVFSAPLLDPRKDHIRWPEVREALSWLEGNFTSVMLPEFQSSSGGFGEHDEGLHVTGYWEADYLIEGRDMTCDDQRFPGMCQLLRAVDDVLPTRSGIQFSGIPSLLQARFARLHPGTLVVDHTADTNQRIKIHCGVVNPSRVSMQIADTVLTWEEGKCYVVDDSFAHSI